MMGPFNAEIVIVIRCHVGSECSEQVKTNSHSVPTGCWTESALLRIRNRINVQCTISEAILCGCMIP